MLVPRGTRENSLANRDILLHPDAGIDHAAFAA